MGRLRHKRERIAFGGLSVRIALTFLAAAMVAGCSGSKAAQAEEEYRIVSEKGSLAEQCTKAKEVRDAYLAAKDSKNYETWQVYASIDCQTAELRGGSLPANDKQREEIERSVAATVDQIEANAAAAADEARAAIDNAQNAIADDAGE